ncbi:hypothetical protein ACN28S_04465 [Cystobacter fuscus]
MKTFRATLVTLFALPLVALAGNPAAGQKPAAKLAVQEDCPHPKEASADAKPNAGWTLTRGEALKGAPAVKLADLLAKPQPHDGKTVRVEGRCARPARRRAAGWSWPLATRAPGCG